MRLASLLSLLIATSALAQTAPTPGTCALGTAQATIYPLRVQAAVFDTGSLFFGNRLTNSDGYLAPRATGKSPIFAAGLWLGGRVGGQLRVAGARYTNFNFWPGPLGPGGTAPADCAAYDRIYRVTRQDVAEYYRTGVATDDLRDWPVALGAPVLDGDGDPSNYDLSHGDQPAVRGDDVAWWLMNDVGNVHVGSATPALGVEVRVEAYGFSAPDQSATFVLGETTFYRYTVTNRTTATIDSLYAGLFADPDLGNATDDYVGTDTTTSMGYVYNSDKTDEGSQGYGAAPPVVGFQVARGPVGLPNGHDDDRDGMVDEPDERLGLTASAYLIGGGTAGTNDPTLGAGYYNILRGLWTDGSVRRAYGNGYAQTQGAVTRFAFPGDPVAGRAWSEVNNGIVGPAGTNAPGDRRIIVSVGPLRLASGDSQTLTFAIPYARGSSNLNSVTRLRTLAGIIRTLFSAEDIEAVRVLPGTAPAMPIVSQDIRLSRPFPNPTAGQATVTYEMPAGTRLRATLHDVRGREVAVLFDGPTTAATGEFVIDGTRLAPGVYRVRVVVPAGEQILQVVVAR